MLIFIVSPQQSNFQVCGLSIAGEILFRGIGATSAARCTARLAGNANGKSPAASSSSSNATFCLAISTLALRAERPRAKAVGHRTTDHGQGSLPRSMAEGHGQGQWPLAMARGHAQEPWPRALATGYDQRPCPLARGQGQGPWLRAMAKSLGQGPWPLAMARGHCQGPWPGAIDHGQGASTRAMAKGWPRAMAISFGLVTFGQHITTHTLTRKTEHTQSLIRSITIKQKLDPPSHPRQGHQGQGAGHMQSTSA